MALKIRQFNEEVFFTNADLTRIGCEEINFLKEKVKSTPRQRIRLCMHKNPDEIIHEMIIVLSKGTYVRPHKHMNKCESFHIIEGKGNVFLFSDEGEVKNVVQLGNYQSQGSFYCRIPQDTYHNLVTMSDYLVFIETTLGPFRNQDTIYPLWAPKEKDSVIVRDFVTGLLNRSNV